MIKSGVCLFYCHSRESGNPVVILLNYRPLEDKLVSCNSILACLCVAPACCLPVLCLTASVLAQAGTQTGALLGAGRRRQGQFVGADLRVRPSLWANTQVCPFGTALNPLTLKPPEICENPRFRLHSAFSSFELVEGEASVDGFVKSRNPVFCI